MATRFQIEVPWGRALYKIHLGDEVIQVRNPPIRKQLKNHERMVFAWPCGGEYTITGPNPPNGKLEIISPEGKIWSGLPVFPRQREKLARPIIFLWCMEDQMVACEAGRLCCRAFPRILTLREQNGRRLASWFPRRPYRGCLSESLHEDMKPLVLAMILESVYDFKCSGE